ncbi:response regulator [Lapillicoccus sp.]|uniref:response regulator n=1 Tax=Lapillicoccus sp. TaxID=1909287 RepID=UPI003982DF2B
MVTSDAVGGDRRLLPDVALAETREQLAATGEILSVLAAASSSQEEVFEAVVTNARRLCRADVAQIHILRGHELRLGRAVGLTSEYVAFAAGHPTALDRATLAGRVALDRSTQHITDVLADPEYGRADFQRLGGYRSIMGAPMVIGDEVVGVLSVWRTEVEPFEDRVASVLATFANQAALAVRNVELFTALEIRSVELARKVDQLEALAEIGKVIGSTLDPDAVLSTIVSHAVQLSEADGGSLMEYDESTRLFRVRTAYGTSESVLDALRNIRIHADETLVGRAASARTTLQVPDLGQVDLDPHLTVLFDDGWRSVTVIPLQRPDRVVGALVIRRRRTGSFSDETCELLSAFASQSAVALTNARLYQQLEQQSVELAIASQHKSEFLASMSHELRTPLNAVIGFSEVLLEGMFGELNERQEDYLRDIRDAGRHLLALLNDVLDLSKVEAGQMELEITTFPVGPALQHVLSLVRERAAQHAISLTLEVARGLDRITADELRFKQVLLNLLSNAVKFTADGGAVAVTARHDSRDLLVAVRDNGAGIAPSDQERIFDSFQQGGRFASSEEGTGLGLTVTKRIVELHGGRIWVTSTPGEGSTFAFSLPQAPGIPAATGDWRTSTVMDDRPPVVVIEDDERSAELLGLHLTAAGLRPVTVRDGEEGLEAVRALRPVALILDIKLPGMDGWDVLHALKQDAAIAGTPVVVVSVLPERGRGFALGAADYLVKPVAREDLVASVRRVVAAATEQESGTSIVVIDDDPDVLELIRATLEPLGWEVYGCGRGTDAATMVAAVVPSVVLVDLLMPETDGFAVIDALSQDPRTAQVPVVVLTAKSLTPEDRQRLEGRITFVASKSDVSLRVLSQRLARVARRVPEQEGG